MDQGQREVATVRAFNRFYTAVLGLLEPEHLRTPYTLTQARVVFELAQRDRVELRELRELVGLDAGYLTRIVRQFEADGLVARERSGGDARKQVVWLTEAGREVFRTLDGRSSAQIGALLGELPVVERQRLLAAMDTVREVLSPAPDEGECVLREPGPGDLGWVVSRNGALYAAEYGWDLSYEALVARIVADYVERRDPDRERGWIATLNGAPVGCVVCVRADPAEAPPTTAKLRLLLVDPAARGRGVGARLVDECVRYAAAVGYRRMVLWTNDVLTSARRIYARAGFARVDAAPHRSFGHDLTGETWSLDLT